MSGIDNRIVTMKFDNAQFERGARTSMSTLEKLKSSMNFSSISSAASKTLGGITNMFSKFGVKNPFATATTGAADLSKAASGAATGGLVSLDGAVTAVSNRFIALTTIAVTALSNIANRAINAGSTFLKSFSTAPIMDGLHEYETNLKSIQTVQANTDQPLDKINASLEELNRYSDQTIYNFSEMARNVGTFTAAGVDLETSVSSIKGIANLAALSGSSSEQAATAMYQLSQAIAAGKVGLMDWNSVVNAGMGGKKLQNALAQTAVAMGEIDANAVKMVGPMQKLTINGQSFRESIMAQPGQESWLSSEALVNTLATMDGRFSEAALSAEKTEEGLKKYTKAQIAASIADSRAALEKKNGVKYTDEQFEALQKMSTMAFKSATEVKTLGQVFDVAKETIASGWSASFKNIFGDLKEAKALFTGMSGGLNDIINRAALARNTMLNAWKEGGGRDAAIEGFANSWEAILKILGPIKKGFRDIFPAQTADGLIEMSENFKEFTASLIPGKDTMRDIRDIAGGVFAVLGIGQTVVSGIIDGIKVLFDAIGAGDGDFLSFAAGIGNTIKEFDRFLEKSGIVSDFFTSIAGFISVPLQLLKGFGDILAGLFGGFDPSGVEQAAGALGDFAGGADRFAGGAERVMAIFEALGNVVGRVGDLIVEGLSNLGNVISSAITPATFSSSLDVINTALLGGIVIMLKRFFSGGLSVDVGGGFFSTAAETLGAATEVLQNMQASLKADILLKIAAALAILAASLFVLSTIDSADLTKALVAMGVGFLAMQYALTSLSAALSIVGAAKLPFIAASMVLLATSLLILAGAMKILGNMDLAEIARSLVAIGGVLYVINKAMGPMAANAGGMIRAAAAIAIIGVALNILAVAMKIFATFNWEEMAKGLVGVVGSLTAIALAMKLMPKGILLQAGAILILSGALNALGIAMKIFATMKWAAMGKGLAGVVGSLSAIALAMRLMPKGMLLQAAALVAISGALVVLGGALKVMASMSWEEIGKGLATLGGALTLLAIGLQMMGVMGIAGAIALTIATGALMLLTPVLVTLGSLSWETILKSLATLAGVFTLLGVAAVFLAPLIPVILGLGLAMVGIGAGLALAGAGALAFATAFGVIVATGMAGVQILGQMLGTIVEAIPGFFAALGEGLRQFAVSIGKSGPQFARAIGAILGAMLTAVIKNVPRMGQAFLTMLNTALRVIVSAAPRIIAAGFRLIIGFLQAIEQNIGKIVDIAARIIVNFVNGIARNIGKIIQAGVNLIIKFINGVATAIDNNSEQMGEAGGRLAIAMVNGMANGIRGAAGVIKDAAMDAARGAWEEVKDFFKIGSPSKLMRDEIGARLPQGMALGIKDDAPLVVDEIGKMGKIAIDRMGRVMEGVDDAFSLDPNLNPTVTPVLDLSALTQEANKMNSILATAPIMAGVSYQTAAEISAMTQTSSEPDDGPDDPSDGSGGTGDVSLTLELHSPKPIDSVESYRAGKTLISLAKEALK